MAAFTILEPMSTGDVIDRAVRLYRRNFSPLISIVVVPTLIGYVASMLFWYGYTRLLLGFENLEQPGPASPSPGAILALLLGGIGYPVYMFTLLLAVSGLSRVIGDHVMLNEPITFGKLLQAIRHRLGDITLMGLLLIAVLVALYFVFSIVLFVLIIVAMIVIGGMAAAGLPAWAVGVATGIIILAAVAAGVIALLFVISRVVFLPQVVMIEGQSAGAALSRAIHLGAKNWYRVGGIVLFIYFVELSLLAALTLPMIVGLEFFGFRTAEFFLSPAGAAIYAAFNQLSSLLVMPLWIVSFTLLYFDSRVRKEAYDIELLAREITPGFYWQPTVQPSAFGYDMAVPNAAGRPYVQTSPLGLAGYAPSPATVTATPDGLRAKFDQAAIALETEKQRGGLSEGMAAACRQCGTELMSGAHFCIRCGSPTDLPANGNE